jgi:hypothetical protein
MDRRKDSMDRRRDNTDSRDTDRRSKACTTSKARRRRGAIMTTRGEAERRKGFAPACWPRSHAVAAWTACSKPRIYSKKCSQDRSDEDSSFEMGCIDLRLLDGLGDRGTQ